MKMLRRDEKLPFEFLKNRMPGQMVAELRRLDSAVRDLGKHKPTVAAHGALFERSRASVGHRRFPPMRQWPLQLADLLFEHNVN